MTAIARWVVAALCALLLVLVPAFGSGNAMPGMPGGDGGWINVPGGGGGAKLIAQPGGSSSSKKFLAERQLGSPVAMRFATELQVYAAVVTDPATGAEVVLPIIGSNLVLPGHVLKGLAGMGVQNLEITVVGLAGTLELSLALDQAGGKITVLAG